MGTSLCDVTVTLKRQGKIVNIFFSKLGYIFLQENICLTLLPKNAHGITQRPTLYLSLLRPRRPSRVYTTPLKAIPHLYYVHEAHTTSILRPGRPSHIYTTSMNISTFYIVYENIQHLYNVHKTTHHLYNVYPTYLLRP